MAEPFKGTRATRVDPVPILPSTLARQVHVTQLVSPDLEELAPATNQPTYHFTCAIQSDPAGRTDPSPGSRTPGLRSRLLLSVRTASAAPR